MAISEKFVIVHAGALMLLIYVLYESIKETVAVWIGTMKGVCDFPAVAGETRVRRGSFLTIGAANEILCSPTFTQPTHFDTQYTQFLGALEVCSDSSFLAGMFRARFLIARLHRTYASRSDCRPNPTPARTKKQKVGVTRLRYLHYLLL